MRKKAYATPVRHEFKVGDRIDSVWGGGRVTRVSFGLSYSVRFDDGVEKGCLQEDEVRQPKKRGCR